MHILSKICLDTHSFFRFVIVKSHPDYCHVLILCCIIPIEPSTAIHDVLELRSSNCSDYRYYRMTQPPPIRHPWLSGGLFEHPVQTLLIFYITIRTSKLQTYIHSCTRFHGNDVIYTLNIHDNNQEGTEQFLCKWSASKNAWYVLIFMCYIWYVRKELTK